MLLQAQNLVVNSSFENYTSCPQFRNDGVLPTSWTQPTQGTADYFNACYQSTQTGPDVPANFMGNQNARTGSAYVGLLTTTSSNNQLVNYREYIQSELSAPLIAGQTYTFEMYVSLAENSEFAFKGIGVYLSNTPVGLFGASTVLPFTPQILMDSFITDKTGWTRIYRRIIATGGERYITIGNFNSSNTGRTMSVPGGNGGGFNLMSYYYIDDVTLTYDCFNITNTPKSTISVCKSDNSTHALFSSVNLPNTKYLWNTGDTGRFIITDTSGIYIVNSITGLCSLYDTIQFNYFKQPVIELGPNISICKNTQPDTIFAPLIASNINKYQWSTGDTTPTININTSGTYNLLVRNGICTATDNITINFVTQPPINIGPDTSICGTLYPIRLNVLNSSVKWNTGFTGNLFNITNSGLYFVEVITGPCVARDSVQVTFYEQIIPELGNDTSICSYDSVTFNLSGLNANSYLWNNTNTNAIYTQVGPGLVKVEVTKGKCVFVDSVRITLKPMPELNLPSDTVFCKGTNVLLNAGTFNTYLWSTGSTTQSIIVNTPGIYSVGVSNASNCFVFDTIRAVNFNSIDFNLAEDTAICAGENYILSAPDNFNNYNWNTGTTQQKIELSQAGTYYVTAIDVNGCSVADTFNLSIKPLPTFFTTPKITVCKQDTAITVNGNFSSIIWLNNNNRENTNVITQPGIYSFVVTGINGCTNNGQSEVVSSCPAAIAIPNVFTPNFDGDNDKFKPIMEDVSKFELLIYDRWGQLIFRTTSESISWDGTYKNQPLPNDVYVYILRYTGNNGMQGELNGNVTLLR